MAEHKIIPKLIKVNNEPITSAAGMEAFNDLFLQLLNQIWH